MGNYRAINLYTKFGCVIEGKVARAMKINNKYTTEYLMGLLLQFFEYVKNIAPP